jgi:hypothetical protein
VKRATRDTVAGQVYLDLQRRAKQDARPFAELLTLYTLEGFLARLSASQHAARLILKGGLLLAAYDARRPTRDADFAARQIHNDVDEVTRIVQGIAALRAEDGLAFDAKSARGEAIRDEDAYSGARIHLDCQLASAKTYLKVDVNVGDPITPAPESIALPRLLDDSEVIELMGYPLPMVHAEKIVTALQRGTVNTRWRDFADIYLLARQCPIDGNDLSSAINAVASHRGVERRPLAEVLDGYAAVPGVQTKWDAWRRRQELDDRLPEWFAEALAEVFAFADPALTDAVGEATWRPEHLVWQARDRRA